MNDGGQTDNNNSTRKIKYPYPRTPTKPDSSIVTQRQSKSEGPDQNDGIFPTFISTPTRRGKRPHHFGSAQQIRRKLAKNQIDGMAQSTSKRQLYKNPHFPSQPIPSVTTRRHRQQQMNQNGNIASSSYSTHRGKKRRRQKCPPPRYMPTWRAKRGGLRVLAVEIDYAETTGEEEDKNNNYDEEEEEEDPLSEIDLLCRSHSSDSGSSNDCKMSNTSTENSSKLTQMDQKMMVSTKFAEQQMEVAIDNAQLDRTVRQILRTRSEEMVPDARPQSYINFQPSPCFSLASCLPEFERISTQIGLELREECDSFVFLGLDSLIPALVGSLLCFSESADAHFICVDEFRQLQLTGTFEWSKTGKAQFLDAVFGRCVQFFAIPVDKFNMDK